MSHKTDFSKLILRDALDLAVIIEEDAKERYEELAHQMELHHRADVAAFFRHMVKVETIHEKQLLARRRASFGDEPSRVNRAMVFDVEAPDYDEVRADMSVRQAFETALRAETKAHEFFAEAAPRIADPEARDLFMHLREEESEHQQLVRDQMAKLPPEASDKPDGGDEPVGL